MSLVICCSEIVLEFVKKIQTILDINNYEENDIQIKRGIETKMNIITNGLSSMLFILN